VKWHARVLALPSGSSTSRLPWWLGLEITPFSSTCPPKHSAKADAFEDAGLPARSRALIQRRKGGAVVADLRPVSIGS
jgi:hypothetical protein